MLDDHRSELGGFIEKGAVPLDVFTWVVSAQSNPGIRDDATAAAVRADCAALNCPADRLCFFGRSCERLTYAADPSQVDALYLVDGTSTRPMESSAP